MSTRRFAMQPRFCREISFAFLFCTGVVLASSYYDRQQLLLSSCESDTDCRSIRGNCVKVAETCRRGVCTCLPPFVATRSGDCKRGIEPWRQCNPRHGEVCIGKDFHCIDGQCQCRPGLFPIGNACIKLAQISTSLGSTCIDDSNCLPGMQCRPWQSNSDPNIRHIMICQCPPTHRVLNNTQCVPRGLGDPCSGSDADCGIILDAVCSKRTMSCACPPTHLSTKTLLNLMSTPGPNEYGETSDWHLVDACRPTNGATKRIGQRCTNSLQCPYGHMCARCEPRNLNTPKTCNRPLCTSEMCLRNETCPLCPIRYPSTTSTTSTTTTKTIKVTETTKYHIPEELLPVEKEYIEDFSEETTIVLSSFAQDKIAEEVDEDGVNVPLAVTLPILFLLLALIGIFIFVRYAWKRLGYAWNRRTVIAKCVEALETASSSVSSGLSSINGQMTSNITYFGEDPSPAFTSKTSASLARELESEAASNRLGYPGTLSSQQKAFSQSMYHIHQSPNTIESSNSQFSTIHRGCSKHKYCFDNSIDDSGISDYFPGSEANSSANSHNGPRLPPRSKSIRTNVRPDWVPATSNLIKSRLDVDLDRRKSLQY